MGAAASMQHVYTDAMDWFKMVCFSFCWAGFLPLFNLIPHTFVIQQYFDKFAYMEDFRALDEKKDGGRPCEMSYCCPIYNITTNVSP